MSINRKDIGSRFHTDAETLQTHEAFNIPCNRYKTMQKLMRTLIAHGLSDIMKHGFHGKEARKHAVQTVWGYIYAPD